MGVVYYIIYYCMLVFRVSFQILEIIILLQITNNEYLDMVLRHRFAKIYLQAKNKKLFHKTTMTQKVVHQKGKVETQF